MARPPEPVRRRSSPALTANAFAEDKKRYLEAGMDDYLAKPFDKSGLELRFSTAGSAIMAGIRTRLPRPAPERAQFRTDLLSVITRQPIGCG